MLFELEPGWVESPVYRREDLPAGSTFTGPAIIENLDSTILVPVGVVTQIDLDGNVVLELTGGETT